MGACVAERGQGELVVMVNGWLFNPGAIGQNAMTGTYFDGTSCRRYESAAQTPQWRHGG
jgi:hypothetical protein